MTEPLKLIFKPGINRDSTDYGNTGGWYDINLARWVSGTPQSMGGWQKFTADVAQGMFRSLFPWSTLAGTRFYAAGTNLKYYLVYGNSLVDITPIRSLSIRTSEPTMTASNFDRALSLVLQYEGGFTRRQRLGQATTNCGGT